MFDSTCQFVNWRITIALLLWLGCGEKEPTNPLILDVDGDGYCRMSIVTMRMHLRFRKPAIWRGDNDCDTNRPEDDSEADAWYADGMEMALVLRATLSCEAPDGFVSNADTDDSRAEINPDGLEECDGVDNDCNGAVDDLPPDFEDPFFAVYLDNDGDGFGDASTLFYACDTSEGVVDIADDCDDSNAAIYPDAEEVCDTIDNDCDTIVDEQESGQGQCDECTDEVLASVTGVMTQSPLSGDDVQASCSQVGTADRIFRWVAPSTGSFTLWSGVESIAVWTGCGTDELACAIAGIAPANVTVDVVEGDVLQLVLEGVEGAPAGLEIWSVEELVCDDGNDEDQDGLIDCDDEVDCWFEPTCGGTLCPNFGLVDPADYVTPLNGDNITTQALNDFSDSKDASCFTAGASDVTFSYTAASNGCAQVFAHSDTVDVQLAVYESCAGAEVDCNPGSSAATTRRGQPMAPIFHCNDNRCRVHHCCERSKHHCRYCNAEYRSQR